MFLFIIALIVFLVGIALLVFGDAGAKLGGGAAVLVGIVLIVASCITTVGTKDVGVVTSFGRPTGRDLPNGLHFKAPWQKVTDMDGAIQPDTYSGNDCINVRIGDSTTACVEGTIRWRIVPDQASVLYQDYRSDNVNETIRDSLVKTQFNAALNDVLGQYNPLAEVAVQADNKSTATITSTAPNLDKFSADVKNSMNEHLTAASRTHVKQIEVVSITLNYIHLASSTQNKINDYLKELGATRVAQQHEQTAYAQAQANKKLAASVSHDPNVLVSKCFDAVEEAIKAKYQLPAGFSCWQGGGAPFVVTNGK